MRAPSVFVRIAVWLGWTRRFIEPEPISVASVPVPETLIVASPPSPLPPSEKHPCQSGDQALNELYQATLAYRKSDAYRGLLDYIGRFITIRATTFSLCLSRSPMRVTSPLRSAGSRHLAEAETRGEALNDAPTGRTGDVRL